MKAIEHFLETLMFASRWLLAPLYLGLVGAIVVLLWYFGIEFMHLIAMVRAGENSVVVGVLALVDLVLVANLLIIIIFAGYENFVSKIHVDFADLKMKLIGSIIAISGIELLKAFMAAGAYSNEQLAWKVGIHLTFVVTGVMFAVIDRLGGSKKHGAGG
jgi:uncharacterized protein (TIGR00645 family)